ncbi:potassium transporter TrkG [Eubacterium xylanophilum]|uniref:potassium transporter TrkG n=1 Tax=Eubacterium xylanophilum TaxID=39497 RepID=UPI0004B4F5EF|nr:potassium transporter TrkG [Eubacterium xylanophilum]
MDIKFLGKKERDKVGDMEKCSEKKGLTSVQLIPLGFLGIILLGALLLMLPISSASGQWTSFLTALFTATTSVCVTGGVVVPTYLYWSLFGKIVILLLIQLGGLGIVAVSMIIIFCTKKRISVKNRLVLRDAYDLESLKNVTSFFHEVILGTWIVELLGTAFYAIRFIPKYGIVRGAWYSLFTSISAFCNAGIDILGPDSLIGFNQDYLVMCTTMGLIILGGLGYVVWYDIRLTLTKSYRRFLGYERTKRRFGEHTRLVLILTIGLILGGALCFFILEYSNPETIGGMSTNDKIMNSIFQSVTCRTAGFTTISQKGLSESSALFGDVLMFIGGSPVGTAGGVKTVTVFVLCLNFVSFIRNRNEAVVFGKKISQEQIRKAAAIFALNLFLVVSISILVSAIDGINVVDAVYETVSSISTVGLSRDVTASLSSLTQIIIIIAMFLGRVGPISMALLFASPGTGKNQVKFASGRFYIG